MILRVDPGSPVPPYVQVRDQLSTMIRAGTLPPDHRLPSIRQLANDLDLAPNTVARVYRELEALGLVATRGRHGTRVTAAADRVATDPADVVPMAETLALEARQRGMALDELVQIVRRSFLDLGPQGGPT